MVFCFKCNISYKKPSHWMFLFSMLLSTKALRIHKSARLCRHNIFFCKSIVNKMLNYLKTKLRVFHLNGINSLCRIQNIVFFKNAHQLNWLFKCLNLKFYWWLSCRQHLPDIWVLNLTLCIFHECLSAWQILCKYQTQLFESYVFRIVD